MTAFAPLPYRLPMFTAAELVDIDCLNRNTLLGWIARYGHKLNAIGIEPVAKGATRLFTMEQLGILAVAKSAVGVKQADAVFDVFTEIQSRSKQLYDDLSKGIRLEQWGGDPTNKRPYFPKADNPHHLEGRLYFGNVFTFHVTDRPYTYGGEELQDLAKFPLPVLLIPLDAILRNAWQRATLRHHDFSIPECGR